MKYRLILLLLIAIDALILSFEASRLSISSSEAYFLYNEESFLHTVVLLSLNVFGHNDFALRLPFLLFHLASIILIYALSKEYIANERNRLWLVLTFMLLPGVVSSAVVVSHAGFLIFGLLLFFYLQRYLSIKWLNLLLLSLYAVVDGGFSYLLLGMAIYYYFCEKNSHFALYSIGLYICSIYLYGFPIHGYPRGHFLDTIGLYSAIFTPVIFIYLFYVLYRRYLTGQKDKIWYVSVTALLFSLFASLRQKINIEYFAPYLIVALPLAAQTFANSYRVRLKEHRKGYRMIFIAAFILLLLNTFIVFFNKELYFFLDKPQKNFIYNMDVARELAVTLQQMEINCVETDSKMQRRLRFYGIEKCQKNRLKMIPLDTNESGNVTIGYKGITLYKANVTKLNNK